MSNFPRSCFVLIACFLLVLFVSGACNGQPDSSAVDSILVWSELDDHGVYNVHISNHAENKWSDPVVISEKDIQEILPAVSSDEAGNIWIAWTELHGVHGTIQYGYFSSGRLQGPFTLHTSTVSDLAPSIAITADGVPFLVYSGSDGNHDDIYAVRWSGRNWSQVVKVNKDDDWPDILPEISIGVDGQPVVVWQGYNGEQYVSYFSQWNGHSWTSEEEVPVDSSSLITTGKSDRSEAQTGDGMPSLPAFLKDTSQAVYHYRGGGERKTFKLHELKKWK